MPYEQVVLPFCENLRLYILSFQVSGSTSVTHTTISASRLHIPCLTGRTLASEDRSFEYPVTEG